MRLWTLHPKYLDSQGLVALWREALLARAVLRGRTNGYRHHPQLDRFKAHSAPRSAINAYLAIVYSESQRRGFSFDSRKLGPIRSRSRIQAASGQLAHEWRHLLGKLRSRSPSTYRQWRELALPEAHPLFGIVPGPVEKWERGRQKS
jgi:hypothetical protein